MYAYDEIDRTLVNERVAEFRDQVKRRLSGELTEDEFKILRLLNNSSASRQLVLKPKKQSLSGSSSCLSK